MIDFIIYAAVREKKQTKTEVKEIKVEKLKTWSESSRISELEVVEEGELKSAGDYSSYKAYQFLGMYYPRVSRLVKKRPEPLPIEFTLWKIRESPLVIAFGPSMKVARVAVALMSLMLYEEPFAITPIKLTFDDFIRLKRLVNEKSGLLTRLNLRGIKGPEGIAKKFEVTGLNLEKLVNIEEILESASRIHYLGFIIRPPVVKRTISFRITEWGGGQIYSPPDPFDHEILWLLDLFKQAFFPGS